MRQVRIGMVGLGGIAQKAYLPILSKESDWKFVGAFSPNKEKRKAICESYRIQDFPSLETLAAACDAVFVHSSTDTHYEIVSFLLEKGVDVYVDKPLASTVFEAEKLVALSEKKGRKLMVGFNRRFAPMYIQAKEQANNIASIRIEKHRANSVGPYSFNFTMLDDYLHIVDTARWLAAGDINLLNGQLLITNDNHLEYAGHLYNSNTGTLLFTEMHRKAGTNLERIELVTEGALIRIKNLSVLEIEQNDTVISSIAPSWNTTLKQRGFEGAVNHFIQCINHDMKLVIDGEEALKSQELVEQLIKMKNS